MKKDIEWLGCKLETLWGIKKYNWKISEPNSKRQAYYAGSIVGLGNALSFLAELDVSKQEKVKIPYFIEEYIQASLNYSEESTVVGKIKNYMLPRIDEVETDSRVLKFFNTAENIDLVALAMITENYEVEEEQRYYVLDPDDIPLLERANGQIHKATTGLSLYEDGRDNSRFELTEQEIKDYDERFWAFAVLKGERQ